MMGFCENSEIDIVAQLWYSIGACISSRDTWQIESEKSGSFCYEIFYIFLEKVLTFIYKGYIIASESRKEITEMKYRITGIENWDTLMVKDAEHMKEWIAKYNGTDKDGNKVDLRKAKHGAVVRVNGKMLRVHA